MLYYRNNGLNYWAEILWEASCCSGDGFRLNFSSIGQALSESHSYSCHLPKNILASKHPRANRMPLTKFSRSTNRHFISIVKCYIYTTIKTGGQIQIIFSLKPSPDQRKDFHQILFQSVQPFLIYCATDRHRAALV